MTVQPSTNMWSAAVPLFPIAWDSTMLGLLKECPKKFYYQIILGYQPRGFNVHLFFGQAYHSALEHYDHARSAGLDHEAGLRAAVRRALAYTWIDRNLDGTGGKPWDSEDSYKNRTTLVRSVIWHCEHYRNSPWQTVQLASGKPAVELSFRFEALEVAGESILLCGHMDKLVHSEAINKTFVADHKTSKNQLDARYFSQYTPHNQFSLYTIAGRVVLGDRCEGVLVSAAQIGVGFTRFALQPVGRPQAVLDEWLSDATYWISQAREFAQRNHWPMNDKSCSNYSGCSFARICKVSESHRKAHLQADFAPFNWNPLVVRGDI